MQLAEINKEKGNSEKVIEIGLHEYLDSVFTMIPNNVIIDKGRCGGGATTLELNSQRHSIIVVPNVSIIKNKRKKFDELVEVYGEVSINELTKRLSEIRQQNLFIKIMSTPDSFYKIIKAGKNIDFDVYKSVFLLLDECHSFITEGLYRENIVRPLDYLWQFENKALISTTPYDFSDPRFSVFEKIKIKTPHLNSHIDLILSKDITASISGIIDDIRKSEYNLHVFYNSITGISRILPIFKDIEDVNIFCAEIDENYEKLDNYSSLVKDINKDGLIQKKVNFYTTKYYEGWDLYDDKAMILLVTDVNFDTTCVDIRTKGIQAVGRLRNRAIKVAHLSNTRNSESVEREDIVGQIMQDAHSDISLYNDILEKYNFGTLWTQSFMKGLKSGIDRFALFDSENHTAEMDYNKLDAEIYRSVALSVYNNRDSIISEWENAHFSVSLYESEIQLSLEERRILKDSRINKSKKNKVLFDKFKTFYEQDRSTFTGFFEKIKLYFEGKKITGSLYSFISEKAEMDRLIRANPIKHDWYLSLGYEEAERLNFNDAKLKRAYIITKNDKMEASKQLNELVNIDFRLGGWYSMEEIKIKLSTIYNDLGINKVVTAQFIKKFFKVTEKRLMIEGKRVKGFELLVRLLQ